MSDLFSSLPDNLPEEENQNQQQQSNLPEQLQGKSAEEVYQLLSQEHMKEVNQLKAEKFDQQQQQGSGENQQQSQQTQQAQQGYQQNYQQYPSYNQQTYNPYQYGQGFQQQQQQGYEEPSIWEDPDQYLDRKLQQRLNPLIQQNVQSMKETNKQVFRQQIGQDEWNRFGNEIEQFVNSLSPQLQADPRAYQQAYNFVRASHVDEIANERANQQANQKLRSTLQQLGVPEEKIQSIVSDASQSGNQAQVQQAAQQQLNQQQPQYQQPNSSLFQNFTGTVPHVNNPQGGTNAGSGSSGGGVKLTEAQKQMAEAFGMSHKEYADYAELNTDISSSMGG